MANAPWQSSNCVAIIEASASRCTNRNRSAHQDDLLQCPLVGPEK